MPPTKPLVLFIDAYDSFSNNIISLLEVELNVSVRTVKIDCPVLQGDDNELLQELSHYVAVVCGPGPGHPGKEEDVGIISRIWKLGQEHILPVLGICLGFQSLCLEFGADVKRLEGPQHGMIRRVVHAGEAADKGVGNGSIFEGVGEIHATLYQSLCVDIGQDILDEKAYSSKKWEPAENCPEIIPLAWVESQGVVADSGIRDMRILVAARHITKPFWALQYHPESICTNEESKRVFKNWFEQAKEWNFKYRHNAIVPGGFTHGKPVVQESLLDSKILSSQYSDITASLALNPCYNMRTIPIPGHTSVPDIVEAVQGLAGSRIILESSNTHEISIASNDVKGRYSIIALDVDDAVRFEYTTGMSAIKITHDDQEHQIHMNGMKVWEFLAKYLDDRKIVNGHAESPFWGGFMGYTTYELGLEGINVDSKARQVSLKSRPELSFAWVTRSLVIDHVKKVIHIQELAPKTVESTQWLDSIVAKIKPFSSPDTSYLSSYLSASHPLLNLSASSSTTSFSALSAATPSPNLSSRSSLDTPDPAKAHSYLVEAIFPPSNESYESKVSACQSHIRAGSSYELCLTSQTRVHTQSTSPWSLYLTLRARQPAPFASFLNLGGATLVSASPERFLTYSRTGKCELRPMKGTVRKSAEVSTLAQAIPLLDIPKEKAENLMIVDLVRHDLHGVCGSGNVQVPRLMVVEEYKSVFQMISIVQGQIPQNTTFTGLDVLAASLPPGSMTGAPKKRSCELLQDIESEERSLYSGVVGYMDVGGRGDWSVTIRCMFKWDDEGVDGEDVWRIGAGGAVTALSTPIGEREEMQTKLSGTLGIFK